VRRERTGPLADLERAAGNAALTALGHPDPEYVPLEPRRGRKRIGEEPLSGAERQRRYRSATRLKSISIKPETYDAIQAICSKRGWTAKDLIEAALVAFTKENGDA
jgi:hypothetical protein